MKRLFLTILVGAFCLLASAQQPAQTDTVVPKDSTEMPSYPGGPEAYRKFLRKNIHYPEYASQYGAEGICTMLFVVDVDGSISGVKVLRDIGYGCGAEAIRVVMKMPKWKPGKQRGVPVRVQYNLPIVFKLK